MTCGYGIGKMGRICTHWPIKIENEPSFKMYFFFIILSGHHTTL